MSPLTQYADKLFGMKEPFIENFILNATGKPTSIFILLFNEKIKNSGMLEIWRPGSTSEEMDMECHVTKEILIYELENEPSVITLVDLIGKRIFTNSKDLLNTINHEGLNFEIVETIEKWKEVINELLSSSPEEPVIVPLQQQHQQQPPTHKGCTGCILQ